MVTTQINKTDQYYQITVHGEIDASSSIELDNQLENAFESNEKRILLDMTNLKYISSAGLGVFIARLEEMNEKNIRLVFFGLNENVKQVFSLLGLEELLTIVTDKEQAIVTLG
jgi:anti-sigma B factor antagonist